MFSPILITLVSALMSHEKVSPARWALVFGGFAGALLVIQPGGEDFRWAMLLPVLLVGANAAFTILTSRLSATDAAGTTHFITGAVGAAITTVLLPWFWQGEQSPLTWTVLGGIAVLGAIGHYLLIVAYASASPARLTPYLYSQIVFAALGGLVVFGHVPNAWALVGFAIISACGAAAPWVSEREARRSAGPS
jgi:drug/metabolite transporter (DMT)-like permease